MTSDQEAKMAAGLQLLLAVVGLKCDFAFIIAEDGEVVKSMSNLDAEQFRRLIVHMYEDTIEYSELMISSIRENG